MNSIDPQCHPVPSPQQRQDQANPVPESPLPSSSTVQTPHPDNIKAQKKQRKNELCALSKTFGNIPNVPIFSTWASRRECCDAAVHRSIICGICGNSEHGAYSVALSSMYKDDEDGGDVIIYTGTGGRKQWSDSFPPKRIRHGPQIRDQSWDHPSNKALMISSSTGNSVRVIRSWKCPSQYAPVSGYRYDGLYKVTACWTAKGCNGKDICRCRLERLPDQPAIPLRPITLSTSKRRPRERLVSDCRPTRTLPLADSGDGTDGHNLHNLSTTQLATREGERFDPSRQQTIPETPAGSDCVNYLDVKESPEPPPRRTTPKPDALPRYRWDSHAKQLVPIPVPHLNPDGFNDTDGHRAGYRGKDDALTLVPSEDGHADRTSDRAETEYFSDES